MALKSRLFHQPFLWLTLSVWILLVNFPAHTQFSRFRVRAAESPKILGFSPQSARIEGGTEVLVTGQGFSAGMTILLGDQPCLSLVVESDTRLRFTVPRQNYSGTRTLTITNASGMDQKPFHILPKPLAELGVGEITTVAGGIPYVGDGAMATDASVTLNPTTLGIDRNHHLFFVDAAGNRIRRVDAVTGLITTMAGNGSRSYSGDGGPALTAGIVPRGLALDPAGNVLIVDQYRIRRVDVLTGIIMTVAGNGKGYGNGEGGPALAAALDPSAVTVDPAGNLFITETSDCRIRRVDAGTGIITTVAGTGSSTFSGDGGPATKAGLVFPQSVALDSVGNLYIAESTRIRRVDSKTGIITTVVGNGMGTFGGDGGPATNAGLFPLALAFDARYNLLIVDAPVFQAFTVIGFLNPVAANLKAAPPNNRIRRVDAQTGVITTVAGNGSENSSGDGGPATKAGLVPRGIALDSAGNFFISDANHRIRRVEATTGVITTVAGNGQQVQVEEGGLAADGGLGYPVGVTLDQTGNLFVADAAQGRVWRVDAATAILTLVAGNGNRDFSGDGGPATQAGMAPAGLAFDAADNLFIVDASNHRIRRVDARTHLISTVAGNGARKKRTGAGTFSGDGGPAIRAGLSFPQSVALDPAGNLYLTDRDNLRIRRVDATTKIITTIAGSGIKKNGVGVFSGDGGLALNAGLVYPTSLAVDKAGNLFIADESRIRRVDAQTGVITTVAGSGNRIFDSRDAGLATQINIFPKSLALDGKGNLFISDDYDLVRRMENDSRKIATVAGKRLARLEEETEPFTGDGGPATQAFLQNPFDLVTDSLGNLILTDSGNGLVRVVKGVAALGPVGKGPPSPSLAVNEGRYGNETLTLTGYGFGTSGAKVLVDDVDVSRYLSRQTPTTLVLRGTLKQLNFQHGTGFLIVTNDKGDTSNRLGLVLSGS